MTKTENYNLPQWEAHDPVRRADFNTAMETIDEALRYGLTPENTACQCGSFSFDKNTAANTVLKAFTFVPSVMLMNFSGSLYLVFSGNTMGIMFNNRTVTFQLTGNTLKLTKNDESITSTCFGTFVVWP